MCQRCAAVREAMTEAAANTSLAGARNIVVPLALDAVLLLARSVQHLLPESMVDMEHPYQAVLDLAKIIVAGMEFEVNTPLAVLPHEAPAAKFSDTPIEGEVVDAGYSNEPGTPAPKPDQDLIDQGGDILKDMLGDFGESA